MVTLRKVYRHGEIVDAWPNDCNPQTGEVESGAGAEYRIHYNGKFYIVSDHCLIHHGEEEALAEEEEDAD